MSLFSVKSIVAKDRYDACDAVSRLDHHTLFLDRFKDLKLQLLNIDKGECINLWCKGKWSLHQLVKILLIMAGPSDLYLTTWAIQETAVREMLALKDEGLIKNIYAVFDYKIKDRKSSAFMLAEKNFTGIALTKCHAKVTVMKLPPDQLKEIEDMGAEALKLINKLKVHDVE